MSVTLPSEILGVRIPDSPLALAAAELMVGKQPRHLCNHCLRVYILGSLAVRQTGQKFDEELAFVASALHDIGLVDEFSSADQRFEAPTPPPN